MFHRFAHRIIGPVVVAWLLLTVAGLVVRVVVWDRFSRNLEASIQETHLSQSLESLSSTLQDAEISQRNYLLTGNEMYLEPFKTTDAALEKYFDQLADQALHDRALQGDMLDLRALIEVKMAELRETIRLRHDKSLNAAMSLVNSGKGREAMEKIQTLIWQMRQRRLANLSTTWTNTREYVSQAQFSGLAMGLMGMGAGLLALYMVQLSYVREKEERKLLEEKLRAEKNAVEKSAFLANMSHEIRTPMNAILGFGELLAGESLTPKQAQYVRSIHNSGAALLQLINDVLDMSKLEAGKLELHLEPTDVRELYNFLRTMFAQQAMTKSLELRFELEENVMPHALLLDRLRLRQVMVNLVGNAMKFTQRGHVRVAAQWQPNETDRSHGDLLIEIEDTGTGIAPEMQAEIFKPFVQGESRQELANQGTGLGLSIVQRLMQMMGGTIALESQPGVGSNFCIKISNVSISARLPVSDLELFGGEVDFNDFAPATILEVDDNQTNRELMSGLFDGTHHTLRMAGNGREALASILEKKPDIVLMDIRMPVMEGRTALAEIRKHPGLELLPVVAVTASTRPEDEKDLRHRFNGYIRKPFSRKILYKELAQFLPKTGKNHQETPAGGPISENIIMLPATREALLIELRQLRQTQWPALRDSLAINDTLAFAGRLKQLAEAIPGGGLAVYADRLKAYAEAYAVHDLEICLDEFPALIQTLEQSGEKI